MNTYRNYEYHSGTNVVISLNDKELLDCVGISYSAIDSSTPIYGYSSRLFDAVAPGQKVIQGSFVVNYVQPNYVYDVIREGALNPMGSEALSDELQAATPAATSAAAAVNTDNPSWKMKLGMALDKDKWWGPETELLSSNGFHKDVTLLPNFSIQIMFDGFRRGSANSNAPVAGIELYGVYLIGHGMTVQADENVLLEEYNFFARTLRQLKGNRFNMGG